MFTRRLFAQAAAAVPLFTVSAEADPVLRRDADLDKYIAFLAHEHRAALLERFDGVYTIIRDANGPCEPREMRIEPPMFWMPDDAEVIALVNAAPASSRAARVLRAV